MSAYRIVFQILSMGTHQWEVDILELGLKHGLSWEYWSDPAAEAYAWRKAGVV